MKKLFAVAIVGSLVVVAGLGFTLSQVRASSLAKETTLTVSMFGVSASYTDNTAVPSTNGGLADGTYYFSCANQASQVRDASRNYDINAANLGNNVYTFLNADVQINGHALDSPSEGTQDQIQILFQGHTVNCGSSLVISQNQNDAISGTVPNSGTSSGSVYNPIGNAPNSGSPSATLPSSSVTTVTPSFINAYGSLILWVFGIIVLLVVGVMLAKKLLHKNTVG